KSSNAGENSMKRSQLVLGLFALFAISPFIQTAQAHGPYIRLGIGIGPGFYYGPRPYYYGYPYAYPYYYAPPTVVYETAPSVIVRQSAPPPIIESVPSPVGPTPPPPPPVTVIPTQNVAPA